MLSPGMLKTQTTRAGTLTSVSCFLNAGLTYAITSTTLCIQVKRTLFQHFIPLFLRSRFHLTCLERKLLSEPYQHSWEAPILVTLLSCWGRRQELLKSDHA